MRGEQKQTPQDVCGEANVPLVLNFLKLPCVNAPINVKPQGWEGGGADPGEFDFNGSQSQSPHPQAPTKCRLPASGVTFSNRVKT